MAAAAASSGSSPPPMHGASLATSRALRMGRSTSRVASTAAHWVALANQAGADESGDRVIVQFVGGSDEGDVGQGTQSDALREDLSRLEAFIELATSLAKDVRAQLDSEKQKEE